MTEVNDKQVVKDKLLFFFQDAENHGSPQFSLM